MKLNCTLKPKSKYVLQQLQTDNHNRGSKKNAPLKCLNFWTSGWSRDLRVKDIDILAKNFEMFRFFEST